MLNNQTQMYLKTDSKRVIHKTAEVTDNLIDNKISNYHKILQKRLTVKQKYQKKNIYRSRRWQKIVEELKLML